MIGTVAQTFVKDYHGQTTIHPLGLALVLMAGMALLIVPRRHALLPFIVIACFVAPAQRVVVLTLDFNLLRVLTLFGWARVLIRHETNHFRWNNLDWVLLAYAAVTTVAYTLQSGTLAGFVYRAGGAFDAVGMYFLFRMLVRSLDDLRQVIVWFVVVAVPVSLAFVIENRTQRNLFAFFGGVPFITGVRQDRLRCQGAFAHPILAGCFWASLIPLIGVLWWSEGRRKLLSILGVVLSLLIVVLCSSSTPVLGVIAGAGAMAMYPLRHRMQLVRWLALVSLVGLHFVMEAPVWHLVSRVSAVGGSTGWYRFKLIDSFIRRVSEWFAVGTPSVTHWGAGMFKGDVPNHYVYEGVRGGIASLVLLIATIALAFGRVGTLWRNMSNESDRLLAWALGASLFVHCVCFIGVSYFGQITMLWYLCLAFIGGVEAKRQLPRQAVRITEAAPAQDRLIPAVAP